VFFALLLILLLVTGDANLARLMRQYNRGGFLGLSILFGDGGVEVWGCTYKERSCNGKIRWFGYSALVMMAPFLNKFGLGAGSLLLLRAYRTD